MNCDDASVGIAAFVIILRNTSLESCDNLRREDKFKSILIGYISSASYNKHSRKVLFMAESRNP